MRFGSSSLAFALTGLVSSSAFSTTSSSSSSHAAFSYRSMITPRTHSVSTSIAMSTTDTDTDTDSSPRAMTKKEKRLSYMKNPSFHRRGFKEVRENVESTMESQFQSGLIDELKTSDYSIQRDGVTVYLAKDFGFCWGVERSIALAYEAVAHFPDRTVHITNELIHNPEVNDKLKDLKVQFIEKEEGTTGSQTKKDFSNISDGDVVILPAFGASFEEMELFDQRNVDVVDTTCPWVSKVWNTVDKHQRVGLTSVIHGKYAHEETVATVSFCEDYVCVKDFDEAQYVADYITQGGDKDEFMHKFQKATSEGFDPDTMLDKVGLANQTTMYKKETRAIGQLMQKAMLSKFGPINPKEHYLEFDTICDATQERQDAIHDLVENQDELNLDFILIVGGWDSSNTAHLLEIPHKKHVRSFHIDKASCIGADNTITHRTVEGEIVTEVFLEDPTKDVVMGVTSGASTPDASVQDSLDSIFLLKKVYANAKTAEE